MTRRGEGGSRARRRRAGRTGEPTAGPGDEAREGVQGGGRAGVPWAKVGLALGITLFFCVALLEPKIHTGGDSAHYVLLAESILETGDGYADTMDPGPAVPHTKYPPGFPLLLAPLLAHFGRNLVVLKLLTVALTLASVFVVALFARERVRPQVWLALTLAFAANPLIVDYSHWLLSEAPFLFCTLLALLFLEREREEEGIGRWFWLSLAAILAAYYMRSIGVVFLVAGTLYYAIRRSWKKFLWFNVVGAGLSLPWVIRGRILGGSATPYLEQFLLKSVYEPEAGYHGFGGMVGRLFHNVWIYAWREMPRVFAGSESPWMLATPMKALALVLSALMVVGFVRVARRRLGMGEIFFALCWLAVLLFEEVVSDVRYLVPLVPLILIYVVEGLTWSAAKLADLRRAWVPAVAALGLIGMIGVLSQLQRVPSNVAMLRAWAAGDRYAGYPPAWRNFFLAAEWVGANTPEDAVVTVRKPRLLYLWSGRKAVIYPFSTDPDEVLAAMLTTDYVVVDQISGTTARYMGPALDRAPRRFAVLYRSEAPPTFVLDVLDSELPVPTGSESPPARP